MLIKPSDTQPFNEGYSSGLPTACYAFSKAEKTLVNAAQSKPGDTSKGVEVCVEVTVLLLAVVMAVFGAF